jgi:metal-dependent amidase/aminoacylase/carboxypeptidase family protein
MDMKLFLLLVSTLLMGSCSRHQVDSFNRISILNDIDTLSGDAMMGRAAGSAGEFAASKFLEARFKSLGLKTAGDSNAYFQTFRFRKGAHGEGDLDTAMNVIAFLDNHAKTTVVIGAHYDHLGLGEQGSSLDANPQGKIHNGADDNASGVAGLLALANYFAENNDNERSNFLFVCFSAEELGLLGSKYFTEHPTVDLESVDYMINLDMIGRLDSARHLFVSGTGTSPEWEPTLASLNADQFKITTDSSGTGPSDHTSFYLKRIPVLHFFTGSHSDYHKPSDDVEKINADGEADILKFIAALIGSLDNKTKLRFLETKNSQQRMGSQFKVTLGIMPNYAADRAEGLVVDGVTQGRPADLAGMIAGDMIISLGGYAVKDIYTYMDALAKFSKGQTVPVKIRRQKQEIELQVTF